MYSQRNFIFGIFFLFLPFLAVSQTGKERPLSTYTDKPAAFTDIPVKPDQPGSMRVVWDKRLSANGLKLQECIAEYDTAAHVLALKVKFAPAGLSPKPLEVVLYDKNSKIIIFEKQQISSIFGLSGVLYTFRYSGITIWPPNATVLFIQSDNPAYRDADGNLKIDEVMVKMN